MRTIIMLIKFIKMYKIMGNDREYLEKTLHKLKFAKSMGTSVGIPVKELQENFIRIIDRQIEEYLEKRG